MNSTVLRSDDLAAVLALSAYERAASAITTAAAELAETGVQTDQMTAILLKHFLAHFSHLEDEFERLIEPISLDDDLLAAAASHQPYS